MDHNRASQPTYSRGAFSTLALGTLVAAAASPAAAQLVDPAGRTYAINDTDIVNFALNLEYLEAEFYNISVLGKRIDQLGVPITGKGQSGRTEGGKRVNFGNRITAAVAEELADDELTHVKLLRGLLGKDAVAKPAIDLDAAGVTGDMNQFLVLARAFEDTGVSAYGGAARYIQSKDVLEYAARILAVEAYHGGNIRLMISFLGLGTKPLDGKDILPPPSGHQYFTNDTQALSIVRTPQEVLSIVRPFFPHGLNGKIK